MRELVSRYDKCQRPDEECGKSGSVAMVMWIVLIRRYGLLLLLLLLL